jgi:hypothetical protein
MLKIDGRVFREIVDCAHDWPKPVEKRGAVERLRLYSGLQDFKLHSGSLRQLLRLVEHDRTILNVTLKSHLGL